MRKYTLCIQLILISSVFGNEYGQPSLDEMSLSYAEYFDSPSPKNGSSRVARAVPNTSEWRPFRIETYYDSTIDSLSQKDRRALANFLFLARKYYRKVLQVRATRNIKLKAPTCGLKMNKTITADYFLIVKLNTKATSCKGSTMAFAGSCAYLNDRKGKVVGLSAGTMTICPTPFKARRERDEDQWKSVIKHELAHALGFNDKLFAYFRNAQGNFHAGNLSSRYQGVAKGGELKNVIKKIRRKWTAAGGTFPHDVWMLTTPAVTREARKHFGCPTLEGAELENWGGAGTAFTHFEKRVYENEAMSGVTTQVNAMSTMALAVFEDSGWFKVNYSFADPMPWGKGYGCEFAKDSCYSWITNNPSDPYPFCVKTGHKRCSLSRKSKVMCTTFENSPTKPEYQYMGPGGPEGYGPDFMDYCPYYREFLSSNAEDSQDTRCTYPENNSTAATLEVFSGSARCIDIEKDVTLTKGQGKTTHKLNVGCYETKCEKGVLWVKTKNSKFYPCYKQGQLVHVSKKIMNVGHSSFNLVCPLCSEICTEPGFCKESPDYDPAKKIGDSVNGVVRHTIHWIAVLVILLIVQ